MWSPEVAGLVLYSGALEGSEPMWVLPSSGRSRSSSQLASSAAASRSPVTISGGAVPSRQSSAKSLVLPLLSWMWASAQPLPPGSSEPPPLPASTITSPTTTARPIAPATM